MSASSVKSIGEMHMVREYIWPESVHEVEKWAWDLGAGGFSSQHTCPDFFHRPYPGLGRHPGTDQTEPRKVYPAG